MARVIRLDSLQPFQAINVLSDPGAIGGKVVIPSCAQIKLYWFQESGTTAVNVLYGRYVGVFDSVQADANAMLTALTGGAAWSTLAGFMPGPTALTSVSIRDVDKADQPEIISSGSSHPGTSTSPGLPSESAICVTFQTAFAGTAGRGRMYIPNLATNALGAGNVIAAAVVTAAQNWAASNIPAMMQAGTFTHAIGLPARQAYTGSTGTQHPARIAQSRDVTAYVVQDNHWDSQRRRGLR